MTNDDYRRALSVAATLKEIGFSVSFKGDVVRLTMVSNIPACLSSDPHWIFAEVESSVAFAKGLREGLWIAKQNGG